MPLPDDPNWRAGVPNNRLEPEVRYHRDPVFRQLVDLLEHHVHQANYTPSELREAAILAACHYEMRRPLRFVVGPDDQILPRDRG